MADSIRTRITATLAAALVFCLGLIAISSTHESWVEHIRLHTHQIALDQAQALERHSNRSLSAAKILAAHIHTQNGQTGDFEQIAYTIHQTLGGLTNLQLVPDGIIERIYPLAGHERAIGLDILRVDKHRADAQLALKKREMVVTGPTHPVQGGGLVIVGRQPVFLDSDGHRPDDHYFEATAANADRVLGEYDQFWGFASVLIYLDDLLAMTELPELAPQRYGYRLWHLDPRTQQPVTFVGPAQLDSEIRSAHQIKLPNSTWFLEVAYLGRTLSGVLVTVLVAFNIGLTLLCWHWLYQILSRPQKLQQLVDEQTEALQVMNYQLQVEQLELKKFVNAVKDSGNSIMITDAQGVIEYVNPRCCEVTGYSSHELIGRTPALLKTSSTSRREHAEVWRTISHGNQWRGERRNRRKDGQYYWALMSISPVRDSSGTITHYVAVSEDITDAKEQQLQIEKLAYHDPLTGLSNRRYFLQQLEQRLADGPEEPAAVMFIDLDYFKEANDRLGHEFGDELLKAVARRILTCIRDGDVAARLGGDEFTVLLDQVDNTDAVAQRAEKLLRTINAPISLLGHQVRQSISIGITLIQDRNQSERQLLRQADMALYEAKNAGRNCYRIYQPASPSPSSTLPPPSDADREAAATRAQTPRRWRRNPRRPRRP